MTLVYNIQPAVIDIEFTKGDDIQLSFYVQKYNNVTEEWEDLDMTGMQLDMMFRRYDGLLVKSLSSAGIAPAITIALNRYDVNADAFQYEDNLKYDLQLTNAGIVSTIQKGLAKVVKEHTT